MRANRHGRACIAALALVAASAGAQTFPSRPITLVVALAPGAANDALARTIAPELKETLGAVVVENKPGGNAMIGAEFVKRAAPDGHTVLVAPNQYLIHAAIEPTHPLDLQRDFAPVLLAVNLPFFLVVNRESLPVNTLAEFVDTARRAGDTLSYGSGGNGSPHHLGAELLKLQTGVRATHVPYKGMALGIPDLLSGRIQFLVTGFPAVASHMKSGKLRLLATVGSERSALHPEAPTFAEAGVPGVVLDTWLGFLVPAGTPPPVIARLNAEMNRALGRPAVRERLRSLGMDVLGGSPERFAARMREDQAMFARVVKAADIKPD